MCAAHVFLSWSLSRHHLWPEARAQLPLTHTNPSGPTTVTKGDVLISAYKPWYGYSADDVDPSHPLLATHALQKRDGCAPKCSKG